MADGSSCGSMTIAAPARARPAAIGLVLGGATSAQFGGAVAADLFPRAGVTGMVTLRLVLAAAFLLLVCRPRLRGYRRDDWLLVIGFGMALGAMNSLFYQAIDRLPLGPAVAIEVLGPLVLSVLLARRAASWLWAGLALVGVVLLGRGGFDRLNPAGVAFAAGAATMWAAYIMFGARVARRFARADGLALAMTVAALITLPLGVAGSGVALLDPAVLAWGAVVAILSSALPYTLELLALRRMPAETFAVLMSFGPALATLAGFLVLGQRLSVIEIGAVGLVIAASIGASRTTPPRADRSDARGGQHVPELVGRRS